MNTLSLLRTNLGHWFNLEGYQLLAQSGHHELSNFDSWRLSELAFLGWYHGSCGVNQLKRTIPGCGQILGHHGDVSFVKFGEESKH